MHNPTNSFSPPRGLEEIRINKITMQETGSYNPVQHRPYVTELDQYTLDSLKNRINNNNDSIIAPALISGLSSDIVHPSAVPFGTIEIPNGWTERRIRFSIEVSIVTPSGSEFLYIMQGYTSHPGLTDSGVVDYTMDFIVNSFIRINRVHVASPTGMTYYDKITQSAQIINGLIYFNHQDTENIFPMRPEDIFKGIETNYIEGAYQYLDPNSQVQDLRLSLNNSTLGSNRTNNMPGHYLSNLINNYATASNIAHLGQGDSGIIKQAVASSMESAVYENIFFRKMAQIKGNLDGSRFTILDLRKLDPYADSKINYVKLRPAVRQQLHQAGQSEYWTSTTRETVAATILSNAVPALMLECMLTSIDFSATNHDITNNIDVKISNALNVTGGDASLFLNAFVERLKREIILDVSFNNQESIMLHMRCDIYGDSAISISFGGGPLIEYRTPSFADSLMAPTFTKNRNNFYSAIHDFEQIMLNLEDISSNNVNHSGAF